MTRHCSHNGVEYNITLHGHSIIHYICSHQMAVYMTLNKLVHLSVSYVISYVIWHGIQCYQCWAVPPIVCT